MKFRLWCSQHNIELENEDYELVLAPADPEGWRELDTSHCWCIEGETRNEMCHEHWIIKEVMIDGTG